MAIYQPSPSAVFRQVNDQIIALHLESGEYFTMNEVASRMYTVLTTTDSFDETVAAVVEEYEAAPEQVERDLAELIAHLAATDLLIDGSGGREGDDD